MDERGNMWGLYRHVFKQYYKIRGIDECIDGDLKHVECYAVSAKLPHILEGIVSETAINVV